MKKRFEIKKHLLTGVSYMIPVVSAGGLCMAIAKILGGALVANAKGTIPWYINEIGSAAMILVIPVLTAFIAYSIADRPGIVPGLILGFISKNIGAGFLGGMVAAFIAGYLILGIKKYVKLPRSLQGLMPVIVIPLLSTLIVGLLMMCVIGIPITAAQNAVLEWMKGLRDGSRFFMGAIIGGMIGFDMGGPVGKTASLFANGLMAEKIYGPEAAKIVGGMVPPLGVALSVLIAKYKYTKAEREAAKAAFPLGLCFITEGVLPFAASDPLRVIPACMTGSAIAAGLTQVWNVTSTVPHGGIFVVPIMEHPWMFMLALVIGTCITAAILTLLKPNAPVGAEATEEEVDIEDIKFDMN